MCFRNGEDNQIFNSTIEASCSDLRVMLLLSVITVVPPSSTCHTHTRAPSDGGHYNQSVFRLRVPRPYVSAITLCTSSRKQRSARSLWMLASREDTVCPPLRR